MFRIKTLCRTFEEFLATRDLSMYDVEMQKVLRRGAKNDEIPFFFNFLKIKTGEVTDRHYLDDEIVDAKTAEFFASSPFTVGGHGIINLFTLGINGRKLLRGSIFSRMAYFIEFVLKEYGHTVSSLIGLGIGTLITAFVFGLVQLVTNVPLWHEVWRFLKPYIL